jgi:glucokinase
MQPFATPSPTELKGIPAEMFIALDIGGTTTRVGLLGDLDSPGITLREQFSTLQRYDDEIERLRAALAAATNKQPDGIGISLGGHIASDGLSVRDAANLRDYEGKPLVRQIQEASGCPVRLAHDTVCGLLAEKKFGALQTFDRTAYVTVSTGTGGAIQLRQDGQTLTVSMEMGHQLLAGNSRRCLCGQVGCLETITGGKQIALQRGQEPAMVADGPFWQTFTEHLALGIVNLCRLTRVEAVALSGAIALRSSYLRAHLPERVAALGVRDLPCLFWSQLGDNAPLIGAALLLETPESTILH